MIFVGGTSGSVHVRTFNDNLEELQVIESKRNAIRKGLVYELLNASDTGICSYFAQRNGERGDCQNQGATLDEVFQGFSEGLVGMIRGLANPRSGGGRKKGILTPPTLSGV